MLPPSLAGGAEGLASLHPMDLYAAHFGRGSSSDTMTQLSVSTFRTENQGGAPKFPDYDMPKQGWPCVLVVDQLAQGQRTPAAVLVEEALARWGMASISGCADANVASEMHRAGHATINASRKGVVELSKGGVKLAAIVDGVQQQAFMDIDPSSAPDEVAMWFVEHLWSGTEC